MGLESERLFVRVANDLSAPATGNVRLQFTSSARHSDGRYDERETTFRAQDGEYTKLRKMNEGFGPSSCIQQGTRVQTM